MRGVHSVVDEIRRNVFTEVARLAYEGGDLNRVDMIPYKLVPGEIAHYRHDVFLERAVVAARVRLALGMDLAPGKPRSALSDQIQEAATDQKYFEEPLVNIIPFACNACPPKQIRITDSCQGCISHPCMNVCPKDAIYLDKDKHCHIDQDKCIKCGKCFSQCLSGYFCIAVEVFCFAGYFRLIFFLFIRFFYDQLVVRDGWHIIYHGYTFEAGRKANFCRQHIVDG